MFDRSVIVTGQTRTGATMFTRFLGALFVIVIVTSCSDRNTTAPARDASVERVGALAGFARRAETRNGLPESLDEYFARLADSVPGFAGLYYDVDGDAVIRLTVEDAAKKDLLAKTLKQFLNEGSSGRARHIPSVRFLRAEYDYKELKRMKDWATNELIMTPGVSL